MYAHIHIISVGYSHLYYYSIKLLLLHVKTPYGSTLSFSRNRLRWDKVFIFKISFCGMAAQTCSTRTQDIQGGLLQVGGQPGLPSESRLQSKTCVKKQSKSREMAQVVKTITAL